MTDYAAYLDASTPEGAAFFAALEACPVRFRHSCGHDGTVRVAGKSIVWTPDEPARGVVDCSFSAHVPLCLWEWQTTLDAAGILMLHGERDRFIVCREIPRGGPSGYSAREYLREYLRPDGSWIEHGKADYTFPTRALAVMAGVGALAEEAKP